MKILDRKFQNEPTESGLSLLQYFEKSVGAEGFL